MNKKKKKKKVKSTFITAMDNTLERTHEDLVSEIQRLQSELALSDAEIRKKEKKRLRKELGVIPYYTCKKQVEARRKLIKEMEQTSLLERVEASFHQIIPVVIMIARLIASLILGILSIDGVKKHISTDTLNKMNSVYRVAMSIK